jgi:hypothetical protein
MNHKAVNCHLIFFLCIFGSSVYSYATHLGRLGILCVIVYDALSVRLVVDLLWICSTTSCGTCRKLWISYGFVVTFCRFVVQLVEGPTAQTPRVRFVVYS